MKKKRERPLFSIPTLPLTSRRLLKTASRGIRQRGTDLDSSVIIAAERRGHSVRQILEQVRASHGEVEIGISVITIAELMHGVYRAKANVGKERRLAFIDRLCSDTPVHPVTIEMARLVGRIEGQQAAIGNTIAFEDLVIGVTALQLGFDVATLNVRHFRRIPGLDVVTF